MTEKLRTHDFKAQKGNPFACDQCPYLQGNPIHRKVVDRTVYIKGTAHPNKLG